MSTKNTIHVCIAPSKKIATIKQGKKALKRYSFKTTIPFTVEKKEVETYDYGEWSVSERSGTKIVEIKVYCNETIQELKSKILEYYNKSKLS